MNGRTQIITVLIVSALVCAGYAIATIEKDTVKVEVVRETRGPKPDRLPESESQPQDRTLIESRDVPKARSAPNDDPRISQRDLLGAIESAQQMVMANARRETEMINSNVSATELAWQMHYNKRLELGLAVLRRGEFEEVTRDEAFRNKTSEGPEYVSFPSGVLRDGQPIYLRVTLGAANLSALNADKRAVSTMLLIEKEARVLEHNRLPIQERKRLVEQHRRSKAELRKIPPEPRGPVSEEGKARGARRLSLRAKLLPWYFIIDEAHYTARIAKGATKGMSR